MKRIITLALSIVFTLTAFGQRLEYENTSKWFFGLNAGAAWNTTDVQNKTFAGWGFLIGRSYNYDYGRKLSFDLRLRYLHGKWYGQDTDSTNLDHLGADYSGALSDYKNDLGYTVNNYEANVHELGLELAVHFNRFRDRTGWDPYIFGGANIVWNQTYGDLLNQDVFLIGDSSTYAYDQIDMSKPAIQSELDENYESALDGTGAGKFNVDFMPSLGVGLGYDFGSRFSMGIEHKTTFALKDDFDGYVDAEPRWGFFKNDIYHYTSAYMTWRFRSNAGRIRTDPTTQTISPIIGGGGGGNPCQLPDVRTTRPLQRTETVETQSYVFRAEVKFVQSRNEILMKVNGIETTNFLYNPDTHQLESYLNLQSGNNTIEISARNGCGTDKEISTIIFNNCIDPNVYFENVNSNTATAQVEQSAYTVQAQISNATSIEFTVNGVRSTNFTYNNATGQFSSNVLLNVGQNTIRITALNACGTDTGTSVVTYTDCADPLVNIANGNNGFLSVSQYNFNLSAYVYNITDKNNISVRLNGSNKNFSFNTSTKLVSASLVLNQGQNTIQVTATNNCGSDTETFTIEYTPCVNPSIQMIQPLAQSTATSNGTQVVKAKMFNVANLNQIQLFVNGNLQQGGTFNAITRMFEASVGLNAGFNSIKITVLNDCGSDTETISVNYNPCSAPDVQMILPSASGGLVSSPSQLVQAMVFNVNNINEIKTYVNGSLQNGGTYSGVNGLYQITVGLTLGLNTIQIVATNSCGSDVETVTITYRACEAPVITFTSPNTNPFYTSATYLNISAMIGSITNASQVQLTVNGVLDASGATYTTGSLTYTNNVALNAGNNVINITATNSCGTVSKQINVIREIVVIGTPNEEDSIVICFVFCNNVGTPETMTIPLSAWPSYQSQGALLGPCPVVVDPVDLPLTICFTINGTPTTVEILTSEWPAYQALGATQGPCPVQTMNICFNENQLTIPVSQWNIYQSQGAIEGPCPVLVEDSIIICHKPPGNPTNTQELLIPLSAWPAHQAHGDDLGPCPTVDPELVICLNGTQMTVLTSQWASYQAQGATQGPCPVVVEDPITICHKPPGNPTNTQELQIPLSAWPAHQAHGDVLGPCPTVDPDMVICLNGTQVTILTSEWATYQAQGATQGPCPVVVDSSMTICFVVNGVRTTIEILTSEWATYQAQGATQGPCPTLTDPSMKICTVVNGVPTTMTILTSQWATYQAQGATMGACIATSDPSIPICLNGVSMTILTSKLPGYLSQGATQGPCPVIDLEMVTICFEGQELVVPVSTLGEYLQQGATEGSCSDMMKICLNGVEMEIPISEWADYQNQGATEGPCPILKMTICYKGKTLEIEITEWATYQGRGATIGACIDLGDGGLQNGDTLNGNIGRPTNGGGNEDELLFGNRTITICHTPNGSISSQTMQIPMSEWEQYQLQGASLGPCAGVVPSGGGGTINVNSNGGGAENGTGGTQEPGGMQQVGNGSKEATQEIIRKQQEEAAAAKARQEQAIRDAATKKVEQQEAARRQAEAAKRKEAQDAAAAKARQEQAIKDAATKKVAQQEAARREAEAAKRREAQDAAAAKARQEQAIKDAATKKVAQQEAARREAEAAKRKAAQDAAAAKARQEQAIKEAAAKKVAQQEAARRQAEAAKRKAAQEAAATKARQEQAIKDAAAKKVAQQEAKRKAAQEAAAAKARQEKADKAAAAKKAEEAKRKADQAAKEAAAKKAAEEAARKKAEEQRKIKEKEGGR